MKYETKIISAFPGTGKSYYVNQAAYEGSLSAIDSDSSKFDKANFPANYIQHIKEAIGKHSIVFVSSHKEVREALFKEKIEFYLVYPDKSLKHEYLGRYFERGSSIEFMKLISANWDKWIDELKTQKGCKHVVLKSGQYISSHF